MKLLSTSFHTKTMYVVVVVCECLLGYGIIRFAASKFLLMELSRLIDKRDHTMKTSIVE